MAIQAIESPPRKRWSPRSHWRAGIARWKHSTFDFHSSAEGNPGGMTRNTNAETTPTLTCRLLSSMTGPSCERNETSGETFSLPKLLKLVSRRFEYFSIAIGPHMTADRHLIQAYISSRNMKVVCNTQSLLKQKDIQIPQLITFSNPRLSRRRFCPPTITRTTTPFHKTTTHQQNPTQPS